MVISRKLRYALRAFADFAGKYDRTRKPVSVRDIATDQGISAQFLANIFHVFKKKGLLKSVKGRNGGFTPGRPLKTITVLDVLKVFGDPFAEFECIGVKHHCPHVSACPTNPFWIGISAAIKEILEKTTILSLHNSKKITFKLTVC